MDYIPYTTHNAVRNNFRPVGDMPMGQGTRAHSMALFVEFGLHYSKPVNNELENATA